MKLIRKLRRNNLLILAKTQSNLINMRVLKLLEGVALFEYDMFFKAIIL